MRLDVMRTAEVCLTDALYRWQLSGTIRQQFPSVEENKSHPSMSYLRPLFIKFRHFGVDTAIRDCHSNADVESPHP